METEESVSGSRGSWVRALTSSRGILRSITASSSYWNRTQTYVENREVVRTFFFINDRDIS